MFKHLLIPLDGSRMAESVLPVASFFARRMRATVTLIHVIEENAPSRAHGESHLKTAEKALQYLNGVSKEAFPKGIKVSCHVHAAPVKKVAKSIVEHEEEFSHDLILMCTHGHGHAHRLFFGSIAQKVIGLGTKPVLLVPPRKGGRTAEFDCRLILIPLDDNPEHGTSLQTAKATAVLFKASIHLLTVVRSSSTISGKWVGIGKFLPGTLFKMREMVVQNAGDQLNRIQSQWKKAGIPASTQVAKGEPSRVIVDTAQQIHADLIILGTHGRSGLNAFWAGSVVNEVCSLSRIPLLLMPVKDKS
jgi:nucleotide-binding universal stress UspA family protein